MGPRAAVCISLGADGARLRDDQGWYRAPGRSVVVRDAVGAGDAVTAALVAGRLRKGDWPRLLAAACRLGGFVASREGAQPEYGPFTPTW